TYANVGDVVTVSFQASEALAGDPAVAIGGEAMVKVSGEGGLYVFSRTLDGEETTTAIITIGGQTDILGNEDSDATDLGANFEFDFTAPTVVVAAPGTQNSKSFLINATAEANSECRMDENNISFDAMNRFGLSETAAGVFAGTYIVPTDGAKTIYVICRDYAGNEGTDDTGAFTVATTEPSVTTIDPTISGGWETGANVTAALMTDVNATCKYDDDEAATFASMDNTFDGAGTTTHSKTIANVDGINSYYVLCQSADGVTMTSPITISWKGDINNPSTPTRALPANGGTYVTGSVMMWGGSTDGEGSGVASYTLQIDNDVAFGSPEINIVVNGTAYALSGANITALNGGTNYWRVQAVDNAARASGYEAGNRTIVIDKTAPTVEDFSPEDEDTGVDTSAEIYLLFSEEMDVSTFVDENVDLYASDGDGGWVAVDIKEVYGTPYFTEAGVKKSELVVEPEDLFEYNTEYTLVVTNDITDLSGNPFAGLAQGAYTFTTEAFNTGNLSIDNVKINPDKSYAINNHDWDDGWEWEISLTVPTDETRIRLMFSDFTGSTGSIPATGDNIRYYSADSSNGHTTEGTAINVATVATYPGTYLIFNAGSDQQPSMDGYQVVVKVQVRVPASATGGSYAGQFKVEATAIPAP
ncbi:MAG: Ig-like domain-containing protein, partial [Candidatus Paceibacterota bacterium]